MTAKTTSESASGGQAAYKVEAAVRAMRVFEVFAFEGRPLSLAELTRCLGIPSSSCLLLVRTLRRRGYLYETSNKSGYYPTRRMLDHTVQIASHEQMVERLTPALSALRDRTQATVMLSKIQGEHAIYLVVFNSPHKQRVRVTAGTLRPLHSSATGKALLACMDEPARSELLGSIVFTRFTPRTVVSREQFETDLKKMMARGWFSNDRETHPEVASIAVPLRLQSDCYAITIAEPAYMQEKHRDDHLADLVKLTADLRSEHGGYTVGRAGHGSRAK